MTGVTATPLPENALLRRYQSQSGCYTDCYSLDVEGEVNLETFVYAFYTTWLFRLERWLLRLAGRPSTDGEAQAVASQTSDHFAAWEVEQRGNDQILLSDYAGRTRSWMMVESTTAGTRLYFGSAVVPSSHSPSGKPRLGAAFTLLLGFHKLYSRALLSLAARKVRANPTP